MPNLDARAVAKLLAEFGQRTELAGGNRYKARAYHRAAESLLALTTPLSDVIARGELRSISGVGNALAERITKLHKSGTHPTLEALRAQTPAGVLDLLRVPGLRPEKILQLHKYLNVDSLLALEQACRLDRLKDVKGLGPALQAKILQGIEMLRRGQGQRHVHRAAELLAAAEANLKRSHPELERIAVAGEFRRGCELVSDLTLVAQVPDVDARPRAITHGEITVHLAGRKRYGVALLFATGASEHVRQLEGIATERGFTLNAIELRRGKRLVACRDEKDVYAALGLALVPPELREGGDELALAAGNRFPKLVRDVDIRGILHAHTERSDGVHTLEQMATATRKRGYQYFGVADHSQSAGYAGGLKLNAIQAQHAEADALNVGYRGKFRIFKGIESDILADGSLDYDNEVLGRFDFVVASIHSRFKLDEKTQMARLLRAVANPHTTILGHATGRQLLRRPGYDVDVEGLLKACAAHGVVVEINANPYRLELDWRWHRRALELGCTLSINPDAHSIAELDLMRWGIAIARKGGVPKERVLNCMDLDALSAFFEQRKRARLNRSPARAARSKQPSDGNAQPGAEVSKKPRLRTAEWSQAPDKPARVHGRRTNPNKVQ